MGVMTVSVDSKVEQRFRKAVKNSLGNGKGKLGQAATDAFQKWADEQEQKRIGQELLAIMRKGYKMGKILYKHRDELYERD